VVLAQQELAVPGEEKVIVMRNLTMHIEGMSCNHCKMAVEKALQGVTGVSKAEVDLQKKTAAITVQGTVANDSLIRAVEDAGYIVKSVS
jgi:copper chaperone CopZ